MDDQIFVLMCEWDTEVGKGCEAHLYSFEQMAQQEMEQEYLDRLREIQKEGRSADIDLSQTYLDRKAAEIHMAGAVDGCFHWSISRRDVNRELPPVETKWQVCESGRLMLSYRKRDSKGAWHRVESEMHRGMGCVTERFCNIPKNPDDDPECLKNMAGYGASCWNEFHRICGANARGILEELYSRGPYNGEVTGIREFLSRAEADAFTKSYVVISSLPFKAEKNYIPGTGMICYVPEGADGIKDCYTCEDFIHLCAGDEEKARELFRLCEGQDPKTLMEEKKDGEIQEENGGGPKSYILMHIKEDLSSRKILESRSVGPYFNKNVAKEEMISWFHETTDAYAKRGLRLCSSWTLTGSDYLDAYYSSGQGLDGGTEQVRWIIQEITLPKIPVAVVVKNGAVQNVYSPFPGVDVELIDFDDNTREEKAGECEQRIEELKKKTYPVFEI